MRCQRCQFENVPGESRCFKCGSVLSGQSVAVDIHPPRMGKLAGPFRAVFRWFRFRRVLPDTKISTHIPAFLKIMSGDAFLGVILSIIPGLAHYAEGRLREVRWLVLGWFLLLSAGMFFYGSSFGWLMLGFAIGLHGWIAFRHKLLNEIGEMNKKMYMLAMLLVAFGFLYWGIRRVAFRDFVWGYANAGIPYQNIQSGDCLLGRRSRAREEDVLPRGSLVFGRFRELRGGRGGPDRRYNTIGQIVALPGETIEIKGGKFIVNGQILDSDKFPVPGWLSGIQLSATIPFDSYFVSTVYRVTGANMPGDMIRDACILPKGDIEALAVMRWFPLERRGFLRSYE
ncbi:MAG: hypothetical protein ABII09_12250 [Planctomycetota bacterium]